MLYIKKTNLEILQELYLSPTLGWFPVNITVNTVNPFQDDDVNKTIQLSDSIVVAEWDIDAFVAIYPNHSSYTFKNKGDYSSKIKLLNSDTVYRVNKSEEIESNNLFIELPVEAFQSGKRVHLKNVEVPFTLSGSLTTIGTLSLNSDIDFNRLQYNKDILKTYKDKDLMIDVDKMTNDEYNSFLNLAYRIVGVHFVNMKMVTKQKITYKELEDYRKKSKDYDKPKYDFEEDESGMFNQHKAYSKEAQEQLLKEKEMAQSFIDKIKERAGEMMASAIPEYEDKVNKFLESIEPIKKEHLKLFPIYRAAELFLGKDNNPDGNDICDRFLFFDADSIYDGDINLKKGFIEKLDKFFKDSNILMRPVPLYYNDWKTLFISEPKAVFTSQTAWWTDCREKQSSTKEDREKIVDWLISRFTGNLLVHDKKFESYLFDSDFKPDIKPFKECLEKMAYLKEVKSTYFDLGSFVGTENQYLLDKEDILKTFIYEFACISNFFDFIVGGYNEERKEILLDYHPC